MGNGKDSEEHGIGAEELYQIADEDEDDEERELFDHLPAENRGDVEDEGGHGERGELHRKADDGHHRVADPLENPDRGVAYSPRSG